jgi:hypothetical protein
MQEKEKLIYTHFTKYNKWLNKTAYNLCKCEDEAKDMVSNLKLRLLEMSDNAIDKIKHKEELNNFYLHKMLKSKYLNDKKQSPLFVSLSIDDYDTIDSNYDYYEDEAFYDMEECTKHFFEASASRGDVKMFVDYVMSGTSLEKIAIKYNTNKSKVWTSFDKLKKEIKESYEKEFKHRFYN